MGQLEVRPQREHIGPLVPAIILWGLSSLQGLMGQLEVRPHLVQIFIPLITAIS